MQFYDHHGVITKTGILYLHRTGILPPRNAMDLNDAYIAQYNARMEGYKARLAGRQAVRENVLEKAAEEWGFSSELYRVLIVVLLLWMLYGYFKRHVMRKEYEEMVKNPRPMYMPEPEEQDRTERWYRRMLHIPIVIDIQISEKTQKRLENAAESIRDTYRDICNQISLEYDNLRFNPTTDTLYLHYQDTADWLVRKGNVLTAILIFWCICAIINRANERNGVIYVDWTNVHSSDGFSVPEAFWRHRAQHLGMRPC